MGGKIEQARGQEEQGCRPGGQREPGSRKTGHCWGRGDRGTEGPHLLQPELVSSPEQSTQRPEKQAGEKNQG